MRIYLEQYAVCTRAVDNYGGVGYMGEGVVKTSDLFPKKHLTFNVIKIPTMITTSNDNNIIR